jgi:ferric-chelate reductase
MVHSAASVYNSTMFTSVIPALSSRRAERFVFHVNLFILALFALLVIPRIPRMLAGLWRISEWCNGHILLDRPNRRPTVSRSYQNSHRHPDPGGISTDDSHTLFSHSNQPQRIDDNGKPLAVAYPPHVASSARLLRPLVTILRRRISPGFSAGQFIVLLLYFGVLVYASFYKSSPFSDPLRTGWVATAQFPFVFAFVAKNNILGMFLGLSYAEVTFWQVISFPFSLDPFVLQINFVHRFLGRLVVIAANVHGIGYCRFVSINHTYISQKPSQFTNGLWLGALFSS